MKKIYNSIFLIALLAIVGITKATVHTVSVLSSSFSPALVNVEVGDTVKWIHTGGSHTTTSTAVPSGAATWDSPITPNVTMFSYKVTEAGTYDYICTPHGFTGQIIATIPTGIESPDASVNFNVYSIRPSVFNIEYTLKTSADIKISLFDITGKLVKDMPVSFQNTGEHLNTLYFDDLQNGIYIIQLLAGNQRVSKRIIIE
jgi:plastocyanin